MNVRLCRTNGEYPPKRDTPRLCSGENLLEFVVDGTDPVPTIRPRYAVSYRPSFAGERRGDWTRTNAVVLELAREQNDQGSQLGTCCKDLESHGRRCRLIDGRIRDDRLHDLTYSR